MSGSAAPRLALVGDIGGTNARFALVDLATPTSLVAPEDVRCRDYPNAIDAIEAYLARRGLAAPPAAALVAVAGPVENGAIRFTNMDWTLAERELEAWGVGRARLVNDYVALALAAPRLQAADTRALGPDIEGDADGSIGVVGPGTGFGAAALARDGAGGETAIATEGGHVSFAPADEVEIGVLRWLAARFGRVSIERILSGPGLCQLHAALEALHGRTSTMQDPAEVTRGAQAGDRACAETVERFCAILGSVAGDFALAYGARGGVFIAGGIPPLILDLLQASRFRERFEDKGRFRPYLQAIPTRVIVRPHAALLGAAVAARALA